MSKKGISKYLKEDNNFYDGDYNEADWEEEAMGEEREPVEEYVISFEPGEYYDQYHGEFITEDKDEADNLFNELKEEHKLDQVDQYIRKVWEWDRVNEEYYEGDVDVYFNAGDEVELYDEAKKVTEADDHYKDLEPIPSKLYNKILNIVEEYSEALEDDDEDVFGGTEDSYANEMLEDRLADLYEDFEFKKYVMEHWDTTTQEDAIKSYTFVLDKLADAIRNNTLSKYKEASKKTEAEDYITHIDDELEVADEISEYLESNQLYPVDVYAADDRIMVDIQWGDWKHDHLRCDALMEAKGYTLVEEEVTEEDGSDCYSAIRHYIPKGSGKTLDEAKDKFDKEELQAVSDSIDTALDDLQLTSNGTVGDMEDKVLRDELKGTEQTVDRYISRMSESKLTERAVDGKVVSTGLNDSKAKDVLNSVIGQMSDGIWENTSQMNRYWNYADIVEENGELGIRVDTEDYSSGFKGKTDDEVRRFFANKVKQIAKIYIDDYKHKNNNLKWDRNCTEECEYLDYHTGVTIQDAYRVYDKLLGRIDRIKTEAKPEESDKEIWENVEQIVDAADNELAPDQSAEYDYDEHIKFILYRDREYEDIFVIYVDVDGQPQDDDEDLRTAEDIHLEDLDATMVDIIKKLQGKEVKKEVKVKTESVNNKVKVNVYQIESIGTCEYRFMDYDFAKSKGGPDLKDYTKVAEVELEVRDTDVTYVLDEVYTYGNTNSEYYQNNPDARSISVSDILEYNGEFYYVDDFGFEKLETKKEVKTEEVEMLSKHFKTIDRLYVEEVLNNLLSLRGIDTNKYQFEVYIDGSDYREYGYTQYDVGLYESDDRNSGHLVEEIIRGAKEDTEGIVKALEKLYSDIENGKYDKYKEVKTESKRKAVNIQWDTDGEDIDLPTEIEIPYEVEDEDIGDYITDQTGFCHFGYDVQMGKLDKEDFSQDILDFLFDNDVISAAEYDNMDDVEYWEDLYNEGLAKANELNDDEMASSIAQEIEYLYNRQQGWESPEDNDLEENKKITEAYCYNLKVRNADGNLYDIFFKADTKADSLDAVKDLAQKSNELSVDEKENADFAEKYEILPEFIYDDIVGKLKKKTEAEDMEAVKDNIEKAKEDTESTEQEIEQVKGSLEVLKTDEEEAIAGYDTFVDNSSKVVDDKLADAIDDEMQEIIQDEKDHIEKLDTIKTSLGESKKSSKKLDYKLDGFKGVNILVVDKKNNINAEEYLDFDSMEFGIDEYEFEADMKDGIKDILSNLYKYTDAYYDDVYTEDEIDEIAGDITQDVLQLYDDLPEDKIDRKNGYANLSESRYVVYDYADGNTMQDEEEKGLEPSQFTIYDNEVDNFYYDEAGNNPVFDTEKDAEEYIKKNLTEAIDPEAVKEKVEKAKEDIGLKQAEEMVDTENELTDGIKKEIIQYAKQQGLDVDKLQKQGVLDTVGDTLDELVGEMVSKSAVEFMNNTGKNITWDFEVKDNDIHIIWNEI